MSITLDEILSQTEAWQEAVEVTIEQTDRWLPLFDDIDYIIFTGCGSTYYLSLAASALLQSLTQYPVRGIPGSELALNPSSVLHRGTPLLIAVSRSGATGETIRAVETFREQTEGSVIAITTDSSQPLATLADVAIAIESAQEQSVVQTRSFSSMYLASVVLAALAAGRDDLIEPLRETPIIGRWVISEAYVAVESIGWDLDLSRFYFLGGGPLYGLAAEASLKMKEMSLSVSEPFHFLEFRHGPMSMVDRDTLLVGLLSERNHRHERSVLNEMAELGARTFSVGETHATFGLRSGLPEDVRGVLYLPPLQLMAYYRAISRGLDPDHPRHLSAVVNALH